MGGIPYKIALPVSPEPTASTARDHPDIQRLGFKGSYQPLKPGRR